MGELCTYLRKRAEEEDSDPSGVGFFRKTLSSPNLMPALGGKADPLIDEVGQGGWYNAYKNLTKFQKTINSYKNEQGVFDKARWKAEQQKDMPFTQATMENFALGQPQVQNLQQTVINKGVGKLGDWLLKHKGAVIGGGVLGAGLLGTGLNYMSGRGERQDATDAEGKRRKPKWNEAANWRPPAPSRAQVLADSLTR